jgi:tetratricopeptide (TPR) repeat protein
MSRAELVLNYTKTLIWPGLIVICIIFFHGPIKNLIERFSHGNFEASIMGVEISASSNEALLQLQAKKQQLQEANQRMEAQIRELNKINNQLATKLEEALKELEQSENPPPSIRQSRVDSEETIQKGRILSEELSENVQDVSRIINQGRFDKASAAEESGFQAFIDGNYQKAIDEFREAEKIYPSFHNVYEIERILRKYRDRLENVDTETEARREVAATILDQFSWGISGQVRRQLAGIRNK